MRDSKGIDLASSWDAEYADKGIPSSWKEEPSTVVQWALDNLHFAGSSVGPRDLVLDVGCGTGRNSVSVARKTGARVIGFDYSEAAIANAHRRLIDANDQLLDLVSLCHHDMRAGLSLEDSSVSLVLDIFVYFHLLDPDARQRYRREVNRVLKADGALLLSLAPADDGYYATCPVQDSWSEDSRVPVVLDQHAGVGNIMHTVQSLSEEMTGEFNLVMIWRKTALGPMHGRKYQRVTLATLWHPRKQ